MAKRHKRKTTTQEPEFITVRVLVEKPPPQPEFITVRAIIEDPQAPETVEVPPVRRRGRRKGGNTKRSRNLKLRTD